MATAPRPLPRASRPQQSTLAGGYWSDGVGILGNLLGQQQNPFFQGAHKFITSPAVSDALSDYGAGLMQGKTWQQGLALGAQTAQQNRPYRDERDSRAMLDAQMAEMRQKYSELIGGWGPEFQGIASGIADGIVEPATGWNNALKLQMDLKKQQEAQAKVRANAALIQDPEIRAMVENGALDFEDGFRAEREASGLESAPDISTQPQWGIDPETGKPVMGQLGSDGKFHRTDMGGLEGMDPRTINAERAAGSAFGRQQGGAVFDLPQAEWIAEQTVQEINELKNHPGMDEAFGNIMGIPGLSQQWTGAMPGTSKKDFEVRKDQLIGRNFLAAYETLRGGGQITEVEGKKAEQAMARMNTATSKAEFIQALDDFEAAVKAGVSKLQQQSVMSPFPGGQSAPGGSTSTGVPWSVEP